MLTELDEKLISYLDNSQFDFSYFKSFVLAFDESQDRVGRHLVKLVALDEMDVGMNSDVGSGKYSRLKNGVELDRVERNSQELFTYSL